MTEVMSIPKEKSRIWNDTLHFIEEIYRKFKCFKDEKLCFEIRRNTLALSTALSKSMKMNYGREYIRSLAIANGACIELDKLIYKGISQSSIQKDIAIEWILKIKEISYNLFILTKRN